MSLRLDKHLLSLLFFMFFYLIFHYIWLFIWYDNPKVNHIGLDINSIIGDFAAFLSLYVTYKKGTEEKNRFWLLLALGCLSFLIGDIFWMYEHTILGLANTAISISDCFFLLFTLFYLIAFAYKITQDYNLLQKLFILCDICTTMTAAVTLEYHFFVKNILSIGDMSWFEVYIRVMYPTLNVLLLLMAVSLYFQPLTFASKKVLYILILAIILYVFVDHLYDYLAAEHNKLSIIVIDPLYPAAMLLTAMAGVLNYSTCTSAQIKEQRFSEETNNKIQLSLSYIGAIALVIFAIFSKNLSYEHIIGLSVAFSFVLFREALVRHQNKELMAQMAQFNQELSTRIESRTYDLIHQTEALLQSEQKFKSLYEYHPDPIFTIDLQGRFLQVNKAGTILLGYQASELLGRFYMDLIYESDLDKLQAAFQSVQHRDSVSLEVRAYHKNQEVYHLNVTIVPIIKKDELAGMYIMVKDITEVKRQQKQINYLAYHDTLTGLSNRHCFRNDLKRAIDNAKRTKNTFAVLFVDLD
ncbi:MAG: PAS domain S-box protein, partial [Ectobacillus sp.]